jgi:hypothetical protein
MAFAGSALRTVLLLPDFVILGVLSGGVAAIAFATMSEFGLVTPIGCMSLSSCFSPPFCRRHFSFRQWAALTALEPVPVM